MFEHESILTIVIYHSIAIDSLARRSRGCIAL